MIATFFRDYRRTVAPVRTVHVVTPPTIFTCGVGLEVCRYEEKRDIFSSNSALRFWQFTCSLCCAGYAYVHVHTRTYTCSLVASSCAAMHTAHSHAHHNTKFCEENFHDHKSNHEIHKNIVPRKFGAIRYSCLPRKCDTPHICTFSRTSSLVRMG